MLFAAQGDSSGFEQGGPIMASSNDRSIRYSAVGMAVGLALAATSAGLSAAEKVGAVAADRTGERAIAANPIVLANQILDRWQPIAQQVGAGSPAWREMFLWQLTRMDMTMLQRMGRIDPTAFSSATAAYDKFVQAIRGVQIQLQMQTPAL